MSFYFPVRALQALKGALGLPVRLGWNGDPCVPPQHPWSGADCQYDKTSNKWVIDGMYDLLHFSISIIDLYDFIFSVHLIFPY